MTVKVEPVVYEIKVSSGNAPSVNVIRGGINVVASSSAGRTAVSSSTSPNIVEVVSTPKEVVEASFGRGPRGWSTRTESALFTAT